MINKTRTKCVTCGSRASAVCWEIWLVASALSCHGYSCCSTPRRHGTLHSINTQTPWLQRTKTRCTTLRAILKMSCYMKARSSEENFRHPVPSQQLRRNRKASTNTLTILIVLFVLFWSEKTSELCKATLIMLHSVWYINNHTRYRLWGPRNLLFNAYLRLFPRTWSRGSVKLTTFI